MLENIKFKLLANGINNQSIPSSFVLPPEKRSGNHALPVYQDTPIIDLGGGDEFDRENIIYQIFKAIENFGFFQLINHGISHELIEDVMGVAKETFEMPVEDRLILRSFCDEYSELRTSHPKEAVHYWSENLRHVCHPVEESIHLWPSKPASYREMAAKYSVKARALSLNLLELISEGFGLESKYFNGELSQVQSMLISHYPVCHDPSVTLGSPMHKDPSVITLLLQDDVFGLQVLNHGEWMDVEPLPHAFVVSLGHQLQVISNDKLKAVEHRDLNSSRTARTTITTQIYPPYGCTVGPAEELVDEGSNPAKYKSFTFEEFLISYVDADVDTEKALEPFKLHA